MYCNQCGSYCDSKTEFCGSCGARLLLRNPSESSVHYAVNDAQRQNVPIGDARVRCLDKLKKTRVMTVLGFAGAMVSHFLAIVSCAFLMLYIYKEEGISIDDDPDSFILPVVIAVCSLLVSLPSFLYFLRMTLAMSSLINGNEIAFNSQKADMFFSKISKPAAIIFLILGLQTIPLGIIQAVAAYSILDMKKFYEQNKALM